MKSNAPTEPSRQDSDDERRDRAVEPRWARLSRRIPGVAAVIILLGVVAAAVSWNIPVNYKILLPAPAEAIDTHVTIAGHPVPPHRGKLYITFVYEESANVLSKLVESFNSSASIYSYQTLYGSAPPPSPQQEQKQSIAEMIDSKRAAELAAFNALGHPAKGEEVAVYAIEPQSKAVGKLRVHDVILSVNGRTVRTPQQLITAIQAVRPGARIALVVRRGSGRTARTLHITVATLRNPQTGKALLGIQPQLTFSAFPSDKDLPYKVTIDSGDIGGPSAGLMFALSIINHLSPVDLTHGHKIAGTGTIDPDGVVGPIGGVKQKVIGARQSGAQYFFVPAYCQPGLCNYQEAKPYAKGITLVPVNTLDDALNFLRHLH